MNEHTNPTENEDEMPEQDTAPNFEPEAGDSDDIDTPEDILIEDEATIPEHDNAASESRDEDDTAQEAGEELALDPQFDVDAVLASVAQLEDVIAEQEAAEMAERERLEAEARAAEEEERRKASHYFPRPPALQIERGQMASTVPALILMGIGAWLTLTLTSTSGALQTGTILLVAIGGAGATLVAYWFSSRRWASGALFAGLGLLLCAGTILILTSVENLRADGWPLFSVAVGLAALLTAFLSQSAGTGWIFAGISLILAGLTGLAVTTGSVGDNLVSTAELMWPVLLVFCAILLALPLAFRRRG